MNAASNQHMSNITRRQDLGLGKTAAGGSSGSFASHERAASAAPPAAMSSEHKLQRIFDERTKQLDRIANIRRIMEEEEAAIQRELLSTKIEQMFGDSHPEITQAVFIRSDENPGQLRFEWLARSNGEYVEMIDEQHEELLEFVDELGIYEHGALIDDPKFLEDREYPRMTLVEPSLPMGGEEHRFVDTADEQAFNRALSDAHGSGKIIGSVRTRAQFEDELRAHLSDSVNETGDGDRETYFDDGNIDAWVDDAVERYEQNRPDERDDDLAFRDAIDAANPYEH